MQDSLGYNIQTLKPKPRIVSLVPSHTETLLDLGAEVVGRTKFCVHPASQLSQIPKIGGTKNPNLDAIKALKPDLIITNKEENREEDVKMLRSGTQVYTSIVQNLEDSLTFIHKMGELLNCMDRSKKMQEELLEIVPNTIPADGAETLYLIWKDPWMSVGRDTYIHDMMRRLGLYNVCQDATRYPSLSSKDLQNRAPKKVLLSSEPYPFMEHHKAEIKKLLPDAAVHLVDGEIMSWYGSRLIHKRTEYEQLRTAIQE